MPLYQSIDPLVNVKVAAWAGTRYFAIDYDNGNDSNPGYSDVSLADAGTKAVKTLEYFKTIFPKNGNAQRALVAINARAAGATYRNIANTADDNLDFLNGVYGYTQLVVRGTGTVASSGAVAFDNTAADRRSCGAIITAGTNAAGYNPTGVPTSSVFTCQLAGGGAPGLTAEPALIGKRIRFDSATTTAALQNAVSMIWMNTTDTITVSANLPATPVLTDVFYIEEPGVVVNRITCRTSGPNNAMENGFTQSGVQIVGIKAAATATFSIDIKGPAALVNMSFCEAANTGFSSVTIFGVNDIRLTNSYTTEDVVPGTILTGVGVRSAGGMTLSNCYSPLINHCANIAARFQVLGCYTFAIGAGCYSALGALLQNCGAKLATTNIGGSTIGNTGSTLIRRFRCTGTFQGAIVLSKSSALIYGVDITNVGVDPCISINGFGVEVSINDVVGSTGNTGAGLSITGTRDSLILMGTLAANTFTGAAGLDIVGAGSVNYLHADYARTDLRDNFNNHIQGSAASILGDAIMCTNDGTANIAQYSVTRDTGAATVRAARADTAANAAAVIGVSQSAFTTAPQNAMHVVNGPTWIQFDAVPVVTRIAYLSDVTAGNARDTPPPLSGTNQKLRLGRIIKVSGTLGLVVLNTETLSVLSDGLA